MLCDMVVSIPASPEYPIMNISHAAAVLFYELSMVKCGETELASQESMRLLHDRCGLLLSEVSYPGHKVKFTMLMLRRILGRAELTEREARTLLGLIKKIRWKISSGQEIDSAAENGKPEDQDGRR
jgi:tRNA/rRNA methyltransferase